jgi:ribosomal protein S18 acetylase RimI-like enzyme
MIIEALSLTERQTIEVNNLINICEKYDNAGTCVQMDHSLNNISNLNSWFLYYNNNELSGIASLFAPMHDEVEISICVKPENRNKGIARELLKIAYKNIENHGIKNILYVCDRNSYNGIQIIRTKNLNIHHTEYTLKYTSQIEQHNKQRIMVRMANENDLERIIYVQKNIFHCTFEESKSFTESSMRSEHREGYVGILDNEIIGIAFVGFDENISINTVGIIPEQQNKGYGKELISSIINIIYRADKDILIDVDSTNINAYKLYKGLGFKDIITIDYYQEGLPRVRS